MATETFQDLSVRISYPGLNPCPHHYFYFPALRAYPTTAAGDPHPASCTGPPQYLRTQRG